MNSDYLPGGIAAILLAILFPTYWLIEIGWFVQSGEIRAQLGVLDLVYVTVGGLAAFVFFSLKRFLNDRFAYHGADLILTVLVGLAIGSYLLTWTLGYLEFEYAFSALFIGSLIAFGALDIMLGIWLIRAKEELSGGLKAFAVFSLVLGFCEITVVLSLGAIVIYPIYLVILAVVFLRQPEELQIV